MALIKSLRGCTPVFGKNCYLAENCTIIGDVVMGDGEQYREMIERISGNYISYSGWYRQ